MKTQRWVGAYASCLFLFSSLALIALVIFRIKGVFEPFEHDYAEGIILYQILHIFNLAEAYRSIAEYPHIVFHYTPLYHAIANLLGRTGLDTVVGARLISVGASVGVGLTCAALVLLFVPRQAGNPVRYAAAVSSSAFVLFSVSVSTCGDRVRSDMLGLALATLGIWMFVRFGDRSPMRWLAFVLFTAAVYCKQTMISAPTACLIAALLMSRRLFAQALSVLVILGGGVLAMFTYATSGLFLFHIFFYNVNPFSIKLAAEMIGQHIVGSWPILLSGLAMICFAASRFWPLRARIGTVLRRSVRARALFCVALFTLIGMVLSISIGKQGAAQNYFLEWDTGIAVLAGFFIAATLTRRGSVVGPTEWAALLLPILWVLSTAPVVYRTVRISDFMRERNEMMRASYSRLIPMIKAMPGPVISEDMMLLVKAGKPIPMEPAIVYALAEKGVMDQEPFLERLRREEFSAVIMVHDLKEGFTLKMAQTIADHYRAAEQIGPFQLYRPVSSASAR